MDIKTLKDLLIFAWSADTASGEWTADCPSFNQCAVTALVVQDYFGGELLRCKMTDGNSHYWNLLPDGSQEDLTEDQFSYIDAKPLKDDSAIRERSYVLSFPSTVARYQLLKQRIESLINN